MTDEERKRPARGEKSKPGAAGWTGAVNMRGEPVAKHSRTWKSAPPVAGGGRSSRTTDSAPTEGGRSGSARQRPSERGAARGGQQPGSDRQLTPGERNAQRRQERQAAKRSGTQEEKRGGDKRRTSKAPARREPRPATTSEPGRHRHKAATARPASNDTYRAGFACFVGRPNAGKSTLTNAIVGQKIAITSNKPQTTRHVIRGVLHRDDAQLVLVDTPGLHRPRTLLGERLNDLVRETWSEVDVIGVCFPADEPVGAGDRFISTEIAELKATVIAVVTKVDLVSPAVLAERLLAVSRLYDFAEVVPVSAVSGHQVDTLVDVLIQHLPESPPLYPDDVLTEEPEQILIGELIREAALEGVRDELPHSIAVVVEEMLVEGNLTKIYANVYVERDSQKSIVIGTQGSRLKEVGTKSRAEIEALLGRKIYLDLHVRVAKEWQRDPKQLRKLGF